MAPGPVNLRRALGHVASVRRSFGLPAAVHELQQRAVNRVIRFGILVGISGEPSNLDPALVAPGNFRARFARRDEMLAHALQEYDMTPGFVEHAFTRDDECFTLWDGARLASFAWHSKSSTPVVDDLVMRFDPSWIYTYDAFTHPDYRGRRLHGIVASLALQSYAGRGWRGIVAYVRSTNFRSLRSYSRAGYRPFGRIYLVRAPDRWISWATPGCKAYGFRLESATARTTPDARS